MQNAMESAEEFGSAIYSVCVCSNLGSVFCVLQYRVRVMEKILKCLLRYACFHLFLYHLHHHDNSM